ncbi:hypothetical protein ACH5RR_028872 [Cinchona calisaya]|uniref:Micronuclear linker histone polyprotein-like protein n=1 Tax=Cinchona calisaya TaxID=153742 RepID=A0ABD2YS87_9GENT
MGGLMKGHHLHGSGSRGKPYGLMLLMAFGAAIIGVMVLHKFRERRIFNLVVKEKDRQLTTLQLLLQKERDHAREAKWKLEEVKTKVNTLRTQKRRLDSRIMEMQSTISSLREEQRVIELALEDKQNEVKLMRERNKAIIDNPQVKALPEILKGRESQAEDSKNQLEHPVKVWSVSTDDPSNASINLHSKTGLTQNNGTNVNEGKGVTAKLNESTNNKIAHRGENGEDVESREQIQKVDLSRGSVLEQTNTYLGVRTDEDEGKNIDKSQTGEALGMQENNTAKAEAVVNHDSEVQQPRDVIDEMQTTENKVIQASRIGLQVGTSNAQGAENQESGSNYMGVMKLEVPDFPQVGRHRLGGNGYLKKTKRKRWNTINRSKESKGNSLSNGAAVTTDKSFSQVTLEGERGRYGHQGELDRKEHNESLMVVNESGSEHHDVKISDNLLTGEGSKLKINEQVGLKDGEVQEDSGWKKAENNAEVTKDSSHGSGLLKLDKYQYPEDLSQEDRNATTYLITEKRQMTNDTSITTGLEHISLKDTPSKTTIHIEDEYPSGAKQQNQSEPEEPQKQATDLQETEVRTDDHKEDEVSEQTQTVNKDELEDDKETESDTDVFKESTLNSEADGKLNSDRSNEQDF